MLALSSPQGSPFERPLIPRPAPAFELRPHQRMAARAALSRLKEGVDRQLIVLPTGYGKTRVALALALCFERTLFLCPTLELEDQTLQAWKTVAPGEGFGRIKGDKLDTTSRLVVATSASVVRRLDRIDPRTFDLVVSDEAHHAGARDGVKVLEHFQTRLRLGLTATPERVEGLPLDHVFAEIVYQIGLPQAVREGVLVPPIGLTVSTSSELEAALRGGDYRPEQLERCVNVPARNTLVVQTWKKRASERLTVAFCASVQHARDLAQTFLDAGIPAAAVWGDDPERAEKLEALRRGEVRVITNCSVLVEGFDCPQLTCVLMCCPTRSRVRFIQQAGRGLRSHPGKKDCLIVLFQDVVRHTLNVDLWDFVGEKRPTEGGAGLAEPREPTDLLLHAALEEKLREVRVLKGLESSISLLEPPPAPPPPRRWGGAGESGEATGLQKDALRKLGFDVSARYYSSADAFGLIGQARGERALTPAMRRILESQGFDTRNYEWSFAQAEAALRSRVQSRNAVAL